MTFNPDGSYRFWFAPYSIEDLGTWAYENGVLTLTDKNDKQSVGEGDPIKAALHLFRQRAADRRLHDPRRG